MKSNIKLKILNFVEHILNYSKPVIIPFESVEHNILKITANCQIAYDQFIFTDNQTVKKEIAQMFLRDLLERDLIKPFVIDDNLENLENQFITFESNLVILVPKDNCPNGHNCPPKIHHHGKTTNPISR